METVFWELSCGPIPLLTEEIERLTVKAKNQFTYKKENFATVSCINEKVKTQFKIM